MFHSSTSLSRLLVQIPSGVAKNSPNVMILSSEMANVLSLSHDAHYYLGSFSVPEIHDMFDAGVDDERIRLRL